MISSASVEEDCFGHAALEFLGERGLARPERAVDPDDQGAAPNSRETFGDEIEGELFEVVAGGVGDVAQRPFPG
jgi:hypothetical protein